MPSLRRTASSPAVRSSPYSSSYLTASRSSSNGGHPNRRSMGSDTGNRRVLADIEWWRVTDGQRQLTDVEADDRSPDDQDHVVDSIILGSPAADPFTSTLLDLGAQEQSLQWIPTPALAGSSPEVLRSGFAALSIAPRTPPRRHSRESSFSSLESSPEPETSTSSPLDGLRSALLDLDLPLSLPDSVRSRRREREGNNRAVTLPAALMRSHTFADCLSLHDEHPSHYADFAVSPLSSAPDFFN